MNSLRFVAVIALHLQRCLHVCNHHLSPWNKTKTKNRKKKQQKNNNNNHTKDKLNNEKKKTNQM